MNFPCSASSTSLCIQTVHISLVLSFITAYSQGWGQGQSGRVLPSTWEALDSVVQHHKNEMNKNSPPQKKKKRQQKETTAAGRDGGLSKVLRRWTRPARFLRVLSAQCDGSHRVGPQSTEVWAKVAAMFPTGEYPGFYRPLPCSQDLSHDWFCKWGDRNMGFQLWQTKGGANGAAHCPDVPTPRKLHHVTSSISPRRFSTN